MCLVLLLIVVIFEQVFIILCQNLETESNMGNDGLYSKSHYHITII